MKDNSFENIMKESFHSHEPKLDTDEIWENIEPKLKKKKKRRFLLWIWVGLIGSLFFAGWYFSDSLFTTSSQVSESNVNAIEQTQNAAVKNESKDVQNSIIEQNTSALSDQNKIVKTESKISQTKPEKVKELSTVINKSANQNALRIEVDDRKNEERIRRSSNEVRFKGKNINTPNRNIIVPIKEENQSKSVTKVVTEKQSSKAEKTNSESNTPKGLGIIDELVKKASSNKIEDENVEKENSNNTFADKSNNSINERAQSNSSKKVKEKKNKKLKKKKENNTSDKEEDKKVVVKKKKRQKWFIETQLTGGPTLPFKMLRVTNSDETNPATQALLEYRNIHEKQLEAFSTKWNFNFEHRHGLLFTVGIEYFQLNERFTFEETRAEIITQDVVTSITENQFGEIISETRESFDLERTTIINQKISNQYRFVNLPFGIGTTWTNRKNKYKIIGGVDVNLLFNFKGAFPDNRNNFLRNYLFTKEQDDGSIYQSFFKQSTGFGLWLAGEYNRPISKRINLVLAPRFQFALSPLTNPEFRLRQKYARITLDLGINYLLNPVRYKKKK